MRFLCSILLVILCPAEIWATIEGTVSTASGTAIEHVRVEVQGDGKAVFTGMMGGFTCPDVEAPATLFFSHPRFETLVLEVDASSNGRSRSP